MDVGETKQVKVKANRENWWKVTKHGRAEKTHSNWRVTRKIDTTCNESCALASHTRSTRTKWKKRANVHTRYVERFFHVNHQKIIQVFSIRRTLLFSHQHCWVVHRTNTFTLSSVRSMNDTSTAIMSATDKKKSASSEQNNTEIELNQIITSFTDDFLLLLLLTFDLSLLNLFALNLCRREHFSLSSSLPPRIQLLSWEW